MSETMHIEGHILKLRARATWLIDRGKLGDGMMMRYAATLLAEQADALRTALNDEIDACADIIERNTIVYSAEGNHMRLRRDGDINSLEYAAEIRARMRP